VVVLVGADLMRIHLILLLSPEVPAVEVKAHLQRRVLLLSLH
jgi:hypothetical protein